MVTLKAKTDFNYGGKYSHKIGDIFQCNDVDALILVKFQLAVKEDTSHKKITKK